MLRRLLFVAALLWASPALAIGTINIANAPEWQATHTYALKDRVVAGAAWNGSAYTNGQPLCLFAIRVGGTSGSDPTVFNTACASGTPASYGGGQNGTIPPQWTVGFVVSDGTASWVLLTRVDYVTITGFNCDDTRAWATSTTYHHIDSVVNGGNCYVNNVTFAGSDPCTSAGSGPGPTGTTFNATITDNTCRWFFQGALIYSSQANRLPHQIETGTGGAAYVVQFAQNVTVQLWWGGNQRTHYGPEQINELAPLQVTHHQDLINDAAVYAMSGSPTLAFDAVSLGVPYFVTIKAAPGDRLQDNVTPAAGPLRYDETKGVAIYTTATPADPGIGIALNLGDSFTILDNIQFQSVHGIALSTTPGNSSLVSGGYTFGPTNTNMDWLRQSLVMGGGEGAAITADYGWNIDNSLVIQNSAVTGATPIHAKYQIVVHDSTLICAGGAANSTGLEQFAQQGIGTPVAMPQNNNVVLGCVNPFAFANGFSTVVSPTGANNATDVVGTPSGTFTDPVFGSGTMTAALMPGTTLQGLTATNQLVNPTVGGSFDGRIKNTSASIYGAGATFSFSQTGSESLAGMSPITPGTDVLGTVRPVSSRYDIGAEMFIGTTGIGGGGRSWFH